jgi:hypothetical protein
MAGTGAILSSDIGREFVRPPHREGLLQMERHRHGADGAHRVGQTRRPRGERPYGGLPGPGKPRHSVLEVDFVEEYDPHVNALGVKGLGEISLVGMAPAIANAVFHATGKRLRSYLSALSTCWVCRYHLPLRALRHVGLASFPSAIWVTSMRVILSHQHRTLV